MARRRRNKIAGKTRILTALSMLLCLSVLFSFLAPFSWFFELFSHFALQYAVFAAILAPFLLLRKKITMAIVMVLIFAVNAYQVAPLIKKNIIDEEAYYDTVRVLQFNVNKDNQNIEKITRWIVSNSEDFDVVVLFEINDKWEEALRRIKWAYPYHIKKELRKDRSVIIFSRLYVDELEVKYIGEENAPSVVMRGETVGYEIPFAIYTAHPPPPVLPSYAKRNRELLIGVAEEMAKEDIAHQMLIADMNSTRYSPTFKEVADISGLHDSNEGLGVNNFITTWHSWLTPSFGLMLDNILISDNVEVIDKRVGPAMGSDHYQVISTVRFMLEE